MSKIGKNAADIKVDGHFRRSFQPYLKIFKLINQLKKALYLYNLWINRNKPVQTYFKQK